MEWKGETELNVRASIGIEETKKKNAFVLNGPVLDKNLVSCRDNELVEVFYRRGCSRIPRQLSSVWIIFINIYILWPSTAAMLICLKIFIYIYTLNRYMDYRKNCNV